MDNVLRVLIVDDSALIRQVLAGILEADPGIEVVGFAADGAEALEKIDQLKPDVITLDIDMPVMDGLTAIRHIMIKFPLPIVALSSLVDNGSVTFEALRLGVVDFVPKPSRGVNENIETVKENIINRIKVACDVNLDNIRRVRLPKVWDNEQRLDKLYAYQPLEYVVVIGTTLSGPNTIIRILSSFSPILPVSVIVLQEISNKIIDSFTRQFNKHVPWKVEVARDGDIISQGTCYICSNENSPIIEQNQKGEPYIRMKSSAGYPLNRFFASAAHIFHQNTIGVLLTGVGDDGADGFYAIGKNSGTTIVQDARCCVYPNLTRNALEQGVVDMEVEDNRISEVLEEIITEGINEE